MNIIKRMFGFKEPVKKTIEEPIKPQKIVKFEKTIELVVYYLGDSVRWYYDVSSPEEYDKKLIEYKGYLKQILTDINDKSSDNIFILIYEELLIKKEDFGLDANIFTYFKECIIR